MLMATAKTEVAFCGLSGRPFCLQYASMKPPVLKTILGQTSYSIATKEIRAAITQTGGHLGPVTFRLGRRAIQPFSVAPWWNEKLAPGTPAMLRVLRGDFFCLPFGGNGTAFRG